MTGQAILHSVTTHDLRKCERARHFCVLPAVSHPAGPDCPLLCGRNRAMPPGAVHHTEPAHAVSTRQRASLTLGIHPGLGGVPRSMRIPPARRRAGAPFLPKSRSPGPWSFPRRSPRWSTSGGAGRRAARSCPGCTRGERRASAGSSSGGSRTARPQPPP